MLAVSEIQISQNSKMCCRLPSLTDIQHFEEIKKKGRVGKSPFCAAIPSWSAQGTVPHTTLERADKAELKKPPALASAWQLLIPWRLPVICHKEMDQFGLAWTGEHHPEELGSTWGTAALTIQPSSRRSLHAYFLGFQTEKM